MRKIPDVTGADIAFGNVKHMPQRSEIPEEFWRHRGTPFNEAVSAWFFSGAQGVGRTVTAGGKRFTAKEGVDAGKALAAIRSILCSFEPKHEHKEAACAFLLSEWFDYDARENANALEGV